MTSFNLTTDYYLHNKTQGTEEIPFIVNEHGNQQFPTQSFLYMMIWKKSTILSTINFIHMKRIYNSFLRLNCLLFALPILGIASPPTQWLQTAVMLDNITFLFNVVSYDDLIRYRQNPDAFQTNILVPSQWGAPRYGPGTNSEYYRDRGSYVRGSNIYIHSGLARLHSADSAYQFIHDKSRFLRDSLRQGRSLEQMKEDLVTRLNEIKKYGAGDLPDFFAVIDKKFKGSVPQFVDWLLKHSFVTNDRLFKRTQRRVVRYRYEYDSAYLLTRSKNRWLNAHGVPSYAPDWDSY